MRQTDNAEERTEKDRNIDNGVDQHGPEKVRNGLVHQWHQVAIAERREEPAGSAKRFENNGNREHQAKDQHDSLEGLVIGNPIHSTEGNVKCNNQPTDDNTDDFGHPQEVVENDADTFQVTSKVKDTDDQHNENRNEAKCSASVALRNKGHRRK